jgi:hypothetical protein
MNTDEKNLEVVRASGKKKRDEWVFCKWAAQLWEAEYYAGTPTHEKSIEKTIHVMLTDPCWYSTLKRFNVNTRTAMRKVMGTKKPRRAKKQEDADE